MKPIGRKAYGSIPHLPGSHAGIGDKRVPQGMADICTGEKRRKGDRITILEKLDGSCCAVARKGDEIIPLTRKGYHASTSPFEQHHRFVEWVAKRESAFRELLGDGERAVGEWLAQAHGTRYALPSDWCMFPVFDLMIGANREAWGSVTFRLPPFRWPVAVSHEPMPPEEAFEALSDLQDKSMEGCEGVVYRVENDHGVDFLAKWVRPDYQAGRYLPEFSDYEEPIWNEVGAYWETT